MLVQHRAAEIFSRLFKWACNVYNLYHEHLLPILSACLCKAFIIDHDTETLHANHTEQLERSA